MQKTAVISVQIKESVSRSGTIELDISQFIDSSGSINKEALQKYLLDRWNNDDLGEEFEEIDDASTDLLEFEIRKVN